MLPTQSVVSTATQSLPLFAKTGGKLGDAAAAARLKSTAKEFEATFLSMLLKEMRQSFDEDGGLFPGDTGDVQGGLFDMFLGQHMANTGGIGLAAYLQRQMQASGSAKSAHPDESTTAVRRTHEALPGTPLR
jgi:flagellar protein FlgJ